MNAEEIKAIVQQDARSAPDHRDAIEKALVEPSTAMFDSFDNKEKELWIIGRREEYCITFDETLRRYGIAFRTIMGTMTYLGEDGDIGDAYAALVAREEEQDDAGNRPSSTTRNKHGAASFRTFRGRGKR